MRPAPLILLATSGCLEFGLTPIADPSAMDTDTDGTHGGHHGGAETCNGVDDDGDGQIDEGFPDIDDDGVADCRDEDCDVVDLPADSTDLDLRCAQWTSPVEDPWDLRIEWSWSDAASVAMPVVANLDDDDGDGDIDADDVPDIVLSAYSAGELVALSGRTHEVLWRAPGFRGDAGVTVADIDGDARPEVIGISVHNQVVALSDDGSEAWTSPDRFDMLYPIPTVADLDGDGRVEVIADLAVVDGLTGETQAVLDVERTGPWRAPVVADLDDDGRSEILLGNRAFRHDGTLMFEVELPSGALSAFPAVLQADEDAQAEIAWAVGSELVIVEHDGTVRSRSALSRRGRPGPPCAGDLDGDGTPEVVVPSSDALSAFDAQGEPLWSTPVRDSSGAAGCSVFDMNGDGLYEIIYADMNDLLVLDGRSGAILYTNGAHSSVTYFELPVIADVDQDGSAEIIVTSSGLDERVGVTVFGHAGDGWPPAGPTWAVHDYYVSNLTDGGSISSGAEPGWRSHLVFRGRPASTEAGLPDLAVSIVDACVASCEPGGLLRVAFQVRNEGYRVVQPGAELAVDLVEGKARERIRTLFLPRIQPGETLTSDTFDLPWSSLPRDGLEVTVDPANRIHECDEDDNHDTYSELRCAR